MRIGIHLGDFAPEVGGGFTFQDEVFRSFAELSNKSVHKYLVIGTSKALYGYVGSIAPHMEVVRIRGSVLDSAKESLKTHFPFLRKIFGAGPLQREIKTAGLDCIWHVSGGAYEITDTPYFATVWDLQHRMTPWFPEMSVGGTWEAREATYRQFLQRATYIITGTITGEKELELCYGISSERVRRLPHPTPAFALKAREEFKKKGDAEILSKPYLFYPAQFWPHKNHAALLEAIRILRDDYGLELSLRLSGSDKGNVHYIKNLAKKLDLLRQVHFLGFVNQDELVELYKGALMLVYASHCGPENLPPLEAFALGCPVVASAVPGAFEQLGDAALLFDPKNPRDIAEKIHLVVTDLQIRQELRDKGIVRASQWTTTNFAEQITALFDEFEAIRSCWETGGGN